MRYIESAFMCLPAFVIVFVFLVACYNVTGVIVADGKYEFFLIEFLADLAKPDALFDAESNMAYVTTIG